VGGNGTRDLVWSSGEHGNKGLMQCPKKWRRWETVGLTPEESRPGGHVCRGRVGS